MLAPPAVRFYTNTVCRTYPGGTYVRYETTVRSDHSSSRSVRSSVVLWKQTVRLQGETPTVVGRNLLEDGDEARKLSLRHPAVIFYAVRHRPRTAIAPTASHPPSHEPLQIMWQGARAFVSAFVAECGRGGTSLEGRSLRIGSGHEGRALYCTVTSPSRSHKKHHTGQESTSQLNFDVDFVSKTNAGCWKPSTQRIQRKIRACQPPFPPPTSISFSPIGRSADEARGSPEETQRCRSG